MSDNLVIVALPAKGEPVNKISTEKAAHVTLLFLGANSDVSPELIQHVEHTVNTSFEPLYLETSERGTLGDDDADVLFFEGRATKKLEEFRALLLKHNVIRKLYDANDQFPSFTPHLTLGYPDNPAKEPEHEWDLESVRVDRIAVWTEDSAGPEFKPPRKDYHDMSDTVAWADPAMLEKGSDILAHYGVKGMRWGQRKVERSAGEATANPSISKKGKAQVKTQKGGSQPATDDAIKAAKLKQTYKQSGPNALTNRQLQDLQTRMNLEQSVSRLSKKPDNAVKAFIKKKLGVTVNRAADTYIQQQVDGAIKGQKK